jgi:hypothetical protein
MYICILIYRSPGRKKYGGDRKNSYSIKKDVEKEGEMGSRSPPRGKVLEKERDDSYSPRRGIYECIYICICVYIHIYMYV